MRAIFQEDIKAYNCTSNMKLNKADVTRLINGQLIKYVMLAGQYSLAYTKSHGCVLCSRTACSLRD